METILITCLIRNNEKYIPYMIKMFDSLEKNCDYNFKYLIYTNNNTDKSLELLNQNKLSNMKIIEENLEEDILNMKRIKRLYYLREKLLNSVMKEDFHYLLMLDSDIFLNYRILEEAIDKLNKTNFEAITTNTLFGPFLPFIFYYDNFSLINREGESFSYSGPEGKTFKKILKFLKFAVVDMTFAKDTREVKSSFGGFFLIKKNNLFKKSITYLKDIKEEKCEHIDFNKNFKIGLAADINPLRLEGDESEIKYKKYMNIIMKNNYDNRDDTKNILLVLLIVVILISIILYRKFIRS